MRSSIAIVGSGGWGTALAITMAQAGKDVALWAYEPDLAETMRATRENAVYLPEVQIPDSVRIGNSLDAVVEDAAIVILAVPTQYFRSVVSGIAGHVRPDAAFVNAAKGIEPETLLRMSQILAETLQPRFAPRIAVLSGPTFAPEVARGEPTALVVASPDEALRTHLQNELSTPRFRLYTNADPIGVEVGAATKNIIAIAAGVADGLGLGSNATAALITRGLAEITRLAVACGGRRETLFGLAGLGDLVLTSYGNLSRNRRVGMALAEGRSIADITAGMRAVAEGVRTTKAAVQLARKHDLELPIAQKMYGVLYEGLNPRNAIGELMERKLKEE